VADQNNDQTDRNICGPALKITKNHHLGRMLSGGILLDDSQTKSEWLQRADYHTCIGGEMEGWSVYTVCRYSNVHWIVIKGVCDWREHKIKGYQPLTVAIAVDLVRHVLSWPEALQAIPIQSATVIDVLFIMCFLFICHLNYSQPQAAPDRHQEESHQQGAVFHSGWFFSCWWRINYVSHKLIFSL